MNKPKRTFKKIAEWLLVQFSNLYLNFIKRKQIGRKAFALKNVKKILIYASYDGPGLGDFILYIPALKAFRKEFPDAKFVLLTGGNCGCEEVVKDGPLFDEIITCTKSASWLEKLECIHRVRREEFDLIISEFHSSNPFMALVTFLSGARYRLGHVTGPDFHNPWSFVYNLPVPMKEGEHEVDRYLELLHSIGVSDNAIDRKPEVYVSKEAEANAKMLLEKWGIGRANFICVAPGWGFQPWKKWGLKKFALLTDRIMETFPFELVFLGSAREKSLIEAAISGMVNSPINAAGKTTIQEAAYILKRSLLLICNDSGLMHLSVAMGSPVVAIFGPTDYMRTAPQGENNVVVRKDLDCSPCYRLIDPGRVKRCKHRKCLDLITVGEVFDIVNTMVKSRLAELDNIKRLM